MTDLLAEAGAQTQKQTKYAPIFVAASLTGLYTQRHVFHDPSNVVTSRFYGGRTDTLWAGLNVELSNELTIIRRFGTTPFSLATYPDPPTTVFSFELNDGSIQVIVDTPTHVYLDNQDGTKTTIFTKAAGAGQGFFVPSGDVLYYGDGVDLLKYTPINSNGLTWNWSSAAPTAPPSVTITPSGSAAVPWTANTFYSTMGLLVDSNGNIESLTSVNAGGANTTPYGMTGNGQPAWSNITGNTTVDNTCLWTCAGPITLWKANHLYHAGDVIYTPGIGGTPDPGGTGRFVHFPGTTGGGIWQAYINGFSGGGTATSNAGQPNWNPTTDTHTTEPGTNLEWQYLGPAETWVANKTYNAWWEFFPMAVCEPILPNLALLEAGTQTVYLQTNNNATTGSTNNPGISGTGYTPPWATVVGNTTYDGDLIWIMLGSKNWAAATDYIAWTAGASTFSALVDANGAFQVCIQSGQSGSVAPLAGPLTSHIYNTNDVMAVRSPTGWVKFIVTTPGTSGANPPTTWNYTTSATTVDGGVTWTSQGPTTAAVWAQTYGSQTTDGSAIWANVGPSANSVWNPSTQWYLPAATPHFSAPTASQPYGGAQVIANGDVQVVVASGLSGASAPAWPAVGSQVVDNQATWYTASVSTAGTTGGQSLVWTKGHVWAFSFGHRTANDFYNTNIPPGLGSVLGPPTGSETGGISTASPVFSVVGADSGAVVTLIGPGSTDPQDDTIYIWRDADGGGADNMFLLTEIPNPPIVNGMPGQWTFNDFLPDTPTSQYPGLNILLPAPIDHSNDPPPTGFRPLSEKLHFARIFGAVANTEFFSGGPDVVTGNPNEAFDPVDTFPFQSVIIANIHTPSGLIVPTTTDFECIFGGPATDSFFDTTILPGVGMSSPNAWDVHGGEIYFVSSDAQFWSVNPALQLARLGFPIGNLLKNFNPAAAYVTVHESGVDNAIYVGDGSAGWFRLNPHQVGADVSGENAQVWSPKAVIVNGAQMLQSLVTAPGVRQLLIGSPSGGNVIRKRDMSVFSDYGAAGPTVLQSCQGNASGTTSVSCTFTNPVQNGSMIYVFFMNDAGVTVIFVASDNHGNSYDNNNNFWTLASNFNATTSLGPVTPGGTYTVTVTETDSGHGTPNSNWSIIAVEVANVNYGLGTPHNGAVASGPATPGTATTSVTTTAPAIVLKLGTCLQGGLSTSDSPITILQTTSVMELGYTSESAGGTYGTSWSANILFTQHVGAGILAAQGAVTAVGYAAWFEIGAVTLAFPGQRAAVKFIQMDFESVGTQPTVSYLLDDPTPTSAPYTALTNNAFDPPIVYAGLNITPNYWPDRFYLSEAAEVAVGRRIRLKVDFGSDTVRNELISWAVFGKKYAEQ